MKLALKLCLLAVISYPFFELSRLIIWHGDTYAWDIGFGIELTIIGIGYAALLHVINKMEV